MQLPTLTEIESAQAVIYSAMPPTPQYTWPLLNQRLGAEAYIKHENHSPVGAFKLRGALVYATWLKESMPGLETLVAATRGNHGQGVALAARLLGLRAVIIVPHGNSPEKNRAMRAQGAELIEHGDDFQASLEYARDLASSAENAATHAFIESFHPRLVMGTATYALEFFRATPLLATIYVPIGLGSSICGVSAARNALHLKTEIVGVVAASSPSYSLSFREQRIVEHPSATQIADGLACRLPNAHAMEVIWSNVARIVEVTDAEIASAMRAYYQDTHNLSEGAAAAALAGTLKEREQIAGTKIGIVLTGANVDLDLFTQVLEEKLNPNIPGKETSQNSIEEQLQPLYHSPQANCFGCGQANPVGLKLKFSKTPENLVISHATISHNWEGPPGYLHGGIIASILDEAMSKANRARGVTAMTRKMQVEYLRPVPSNSPIRIEGNVTRSEGRKHWTEARIQNAEGVILAHATGLFIAIQV